MSASTSTLTSLLSQLNSKPLPPPESIASLLSSAKRILLTLNALLPTPSTSPHLLTLARQVLETGALLSIRLHQPDAFTRYFQQLLPFYELPPSNFSGWDNGGDAMEIETDNSGHKGGEDRGQRSKITGLYLLLLLTKGDYAGFHTVLEGLEIEGSVGAEEDIYVQYPIKLERWLMEGSYDRVWAATKRDGVPSEEFGVFSKVLIGTIRLDIASCSEKAYPSLPIANAKNLLFLDSEGSVVEFARERGWLVRDGRIYFPSQHWPGALEGSEEGVSRMEKEMLVASTQVIENTIGYARELETIV
ncbi:26S proteasome non-ATPase regulatory subunit 8 [Pseudocyphellaria aurata]|nr:26S proteasome non-ATPase regulatory subunit 8 [Pseudocyphellaria aurata]